VLPAVRFAAPASCWRGWAVVSNRRKLSRQDGRQLLARSLAEKPVLIGYLHPYEMWKRGPVLFGLPVIREEYPAELKTALDRRRRAMLEGQCDCGAALRVTRHGTQIEHEHDCIASDAVLGEIAARHGAKPVILPAGTFGQPWAD
jgi:hypothetical protein